MGTYEIGRIAREAGVNFGPKNGHKLVKFAEIIAAGEREACKQACREVQKAHAGLVQPYHFVAGECISAIESRALT